MSGIVKNIYSASLLFAASTFCSQASSIIIIDPYDYSATVTSDGTVENPSILGGEIAFDFDPTLNNEIAATVNIGGGTMAVTGVTQLGSSTGILIMDYDGFTGGAGYLLNLDASGTTGMAFDVVSVTGSVGAAIVVYTKGGFTDRRTISRSNLPSGQTNTFLFSDFSTGGDPDLADVDRISLQLQMNTGEEITISNFRFIPEPSTGAMLLGGLSLLAARRRRA